MEGFTTLDFIWDTYDISIGWVKLLNVVTTMTTASCGRLILNMSHWTTLLWYSIPLIYHNLTEIWHGGEGWLWYEQLSPAGPITVQSMGFRPELHAGQSKRSPGLLHTQTLPSTFSYTLPVFAEWHGLYPQVTNVVCHCMNHGNNDHCDQCQIKKKTFKIVRRNM